MACVLPAATQSVATLIRRYRDHRPDTALAQVVVGRAGRVRLVGQDYVRSCAEPPLLPGRAWAAHGVGRDGRIAGLSGGENECQWSERLSAARWIFVVGPPRDRSMAWASGSSAGALFLWAPAECW